MGKWTNMYAFIISFTLLFMIGISSGDSNRNAEGINTLEVNHSEKQITQNRKSETDKVILEKINVILKDKFRKDINKKLESQQNQINQVQANTQNNGRTIFNYLNVLSLLAGSVIGLVALVLGIGAVRFYVDNKRLIDKMNKLLEKQFDGWRKNKLEHLCTVVERDLQHFSNLTILKIIIENDSTTPDEVFPLLTPLCENPKLLYKPLLEKIIKMDIHPEITAKALEGLSKLKRERGGLGSHLNY